MASRERKATEKGREYQLELKFKSLGEAWRSLKSVSEELRSFMAEKRSVREAKVLYARWMNLYEAFVQANDAYCFLLSEDAKKDHFDTWFQDKDIWISNVKSSVEEWFIGNGEEQSAASRRSTSLSKKSSVRLAAESRKIEELQKMEMLLKEKQELERRVKFMELELQQEKERSQIREEIVKSQSRSQLIQEMEDEDADSQTLDEEVPADGMLDKHGEDVEDGSLCSFAAQDIRGKESTVKNLGEVLLELQRPKLEIKKFDGDCLSFNKFMRQFKSRIAKICNDDERMAYLEQYTTGEAHRIVTGYSFLPSDVGYKAAVKELSRRYGDAEVMANTYVHKVLQWPSLKVDDPKSIDAFSIFLKECQAATQCIGSVNILEHTENLRQILKKLPVYMHDRWRRIVQKLHQNGKVVKFSNLVDFVESEAMKLNDPVWGRNALSSVQRREQRKPNVMTAATNACEGLKCWGCDGSHRIKECPKFKESNLTERRSLLRGKKLCFNCLGKGHWSSGCPSKFTCAVCKKRHNTLLHDFTEKDEEQSKKEVENTGNRAHSGVSNAVAYGRGTVPIIPVKVFAGSQMVTCNAFLDPGSNVSFITESLAEKLKVTGNKTTINLKTMGNTVDQQTTVIRGLKISATDGEDVSVELPPVFTKSSLPVESWQIPTSKDLAAWSHLRTISLPTTKINASIDLLIGNNVPAALAPIDVITGPVGSPYATKTVLGWVVWGVTKKKKMPTISNYVCADVSLENLYRESLDFDFPERAANDKKEWSWEDRRFMKVMDESCAWANGHYQVDLPLRDPGLKLPCNRTLAESRLESLKKKMSKNDQFRHDYKNFMQDMVDKGYAEEVLNETEVINGREWYIPHHGVYNPQKPGKIRVVFDCAAKCNGISLNDNLLPGPNLLNSLQGILLRFRKFPVAFSSDVECMFYQVKVPEKHRDLLRFLWWPNGDVLQKPKVHRMTVHLFGAASSPSCANYGLKKTGSDNRINASLEAVKTLNEDFYMDDCLKSVESVNEAIKMVKELKNLCKEGGFNLTKWCSNQREVLSEIPIEDLSKGLRNLDLDSSQLPLERTLGVLWNPEDDQFQFQCILKMMKATRRTMLSVVSSIYDPLGFITPLLMPAKNILQDMCKQKAGWDDQPDENVLVKWNKWLKSIEDLKEIKITRCYVPSNFGKVIHRELHVFSDASELGYGMAIYVRSTNEEEGIHCSLVFSKGRVAPLKTITIPRLELTAATLAVRMANMVRRELDFQINKTTFWTDSTAVLKYIANDRARYHTFVANRVQVIRSVTVPEQWHYVSTKENPADLASRGVQRMRDLADSIWLHGPSFLWQPQSEWPTGGTEFKVDMDDPEVKSSCAVLRVEDQTVADTLAARISNWVKLKRVMAWILLANCKFMDLIRKKPSSGVCKSQQLTVELLVKGEIWILRFIQAKAFPKEMDALKKGNMVSRRSLLFKYAPILTDEGLIRIAGRIGKAEVPFEARHPVVLPKCSPVVQLLVRDAHKNVGHLGKNAIVAKTRERYWIYGVNQLAKKIARECSTCRKYQARPCEQVMADLPQMRLQSDGAPFEHVGMDYFGPLIVKRGRSEVKRYGVIFTCMSSRGAHLEISHSLETDACINAIRRFMARRGPVKSITSDNGTNIVGAEKELREMLSRLDQSKISNFLGNKGIEWYFNPPTASHFGGAWERMIRTTRKILYSLLKEQGSMLDDEMLSTVFCEAENILNNRPLTTTSTDPNDMLPLTPNMLINPRGKPLDAPGQFEKSDIYAKRRWKRAQYLVQVFWSRWKREYLVTLQQRNKWQRPKRNVVVGDIVLIVDATVPRNSWPMGRVEAVFKDRKGDTRSCKVRTKSSVLERPITKLCIIVEAGQ